jgi:hypothetical protein
LYFSSRNFHIFILKKHIKIAQRMKKFSFNESTFIKQQQQKSRYEDCWGKKSLHMYQENKLL